jgi:hypothetical protein
MFENIVCCLKSMLPIIFIHFGYNDYLESSLAAATLTNPEATRIFLGDADNRSVALRHGWEHCNFASIDNSKLSSFRENYRPIFGLKHQNLRHGKDWLKFVFERWFLVEQFCIDRGINRFFSFDSDTVIAANLEVFVDRLKELDCTSQCNGMCLNGYVTIPTLREYTMHINRLFLDCDFLAEQQKEFDTANPNYAFTEMRAYEHFKGANKLRAPHLESFFGGWWFDDVLAQDDGFETDLLPLSNKQRVKRVEFSNMSFIGQHKQLGILHFATLNFSWLPDCCIEWAVQCLRNPARYDGSRMMRNPKVVLSQACRFMVRKMRALSLGNFSCVFNL